MVRHERPFPDFGRDLKMLRCGPSLRPFAHRAAFWRVKRRSADKTDIGFPNFADAAFPRMRSAAYFATQRISPERPFMNGIDFSFRTVALSQRSFLFSATTFGSGLSLSLSVPLLLLRD